MSPKLVIYFRAHLIWFFMSIRAKHALLSDTSVLLNPRISEFSDLFILLSPFCLICRDLYQAETIKHWHFWRQRHIISLHFQPYPRFQKASIYRCGTSCNLFTKASEVTSVFSLTDPHRVSMAKTKSMSHADPQACDPKLVFLLSFLILRERYSHPSHQTS